MAKKKEIHVKHWFQKDIYCYSCGCTITYYLEDLYMVQDGCCFINCPNCRYRIPVLWVDIPFIRLNQLKNENNIKDMSDRYLYATFDTYQTQKLRNEFFERLEKSVIVTDCKYLEAKCCKHTDNLGEICDNTRCGYYEKGGGKD